MPYKASAISLYRIRDLIKLITNFLPSFSSLGEENLLSIIMTYKSISDLDTENLLRCSYIHFLGCEGGLD